MNKPLVTLAISAAIAMAGGARPAVADDEALRALAEVGEKYQMDIKKLFATHCSWCHDGYGMNAGKAPRLSGTTKTQAQVAAQIANGKSGYMPGFRKTLKEDQIEALAAYIKALPAN
jgi:mono/diheme cytochrome c family protein